jgi:hypothetical protein
MPETPINIKVAIALMKAGYVIEDSDNNFLVSGEVTDSPLYYIYRYPLPVARKLSIFEALFPALIPEPEAIWVGTIYFQADPDIYESRFAVNNVVWAIVSEEPGFGTEMDELARKLSLEFNQTKVYLRRISL